MTSPMSFDAQISRMVILRYRFFTIKLNNAHERNVKERVEKDALFPELALSFNRHVYKLMNKLKLDVAGLAFRR